MSALKLNADEKELQAHLEKLLTQAGWRYHHETDSRKSAAGWPDLVAVRIMHRWSENGSPNYPFVLFLECKTEKGKLRPEQIALWAELLFVGKDSTEVDFAIVRPSTLAPIEAMITRGWLPENGPA